MASHESLHQASYIHYAWTESDSVEVNWMPHYHDYGLIEG
jgi:hypothetical protein